MNNVKKLFQTRIAAIDLIRGYFLFVIIIDHLARFFGFYEIFTGSGLQWVSAAEGFFFISGIMIGLVRIRKHQDEPIGVTNRKVFKRALQLYLWSIGLTLFFTVLGWLFVGWPGLKEGLWLNQPIWLLLVKTLTLQYTYGWADFLAYYALFLLITPLAVWLLRQSKWWLLLGLSLVTWQLGWNIQTTWHLLFFGGMIAGYYLEEIEGWFRALGRRTQLSLSTAIISLAAITLIISHFFNSWLFAMLRWQFIPNFGLPLSDLVAFNTNTLAPFFDKYNLAPGRMILFLIWFSALYIIVRRYETLIEKAIGWFLITYGKNSLYVYIWHALIVFFVALFIPMHLIWPLNILINTVVLIIIWILTRYRHIFRFIPS